MSTGVDILLEKELDADPASGWGHTPELNRYQYPPETKIIAVIPAYNEERTIGSVVLQARKYATTVIVVDDGSTDKTGEIAREAGAEVIAHAQNLGKGDALSSGFRQARAYNPDVVITLDADGQHNPDDLLLVAEPILKQAADIVVGSRYLDHRSQVPRHRVAGHRFFNFLTSSASGVSVSDSQSGFRAFSPRSLQAIAFQASDFSVESEMQFIARENGLRMVDVPIMIQYPDPPKRAVLGHGMVVLNGVLRMVGQYRPLLFFGLPGGVLLLGGLIWGLVVVNIYRQSTMLAVGYAMLSVLLTIIGTLSLSTGVILHSIRGLLIDFAKNKRL